MTVNSTNKNPPSTTGKTTEPPVPTATQKADAEAKAEAARKAEEEKGAVGIGDVVLEVAADILDPLEMVRTSKRVVDSAVDLARGRAGVKIAEGLESLENLGDAHRAIDQLKPGGEIEIGRKLELSFEGGAEAEGEVKIGIKRGEKTGYDVSFEQGGNGGGKAKVGTVETGAATTKTEVELAASMAAGATGSVTFHVETKEEAKALMDKGLAAMATGTFAPGTDGVVLVATALANREHVSSVSFTLDGSVALEAGIKLPSPEQFFAAGLKVEGELTVSPGVTYENGVVYLDVEIEAEGGMMLEAKKQTTNAIGNEGVEGKVTLRMAMFVGKDFNPAELNTAEGQAKILKRVVESGEMSIAFEGSANLKGGTVATIERKGEASSTVSGALAAFVAAKNEVEVYKETGDKVSVGLRPSDFGDGTKGKTTGLVGAEGGIELAWHVREKADKNTLTKFNAEIKRLESGG